MKINQVLITISILLFTISYTKAQRKVLIEQFTNSGCPPCAGNTPVVAAYVDAQPNNVFMLAYHSPFPYDDSMYYENSFQSNQRISFYNVTGVPTSRVDGNFFSGNLVPSINTTIPNAGTIAPRYAITFLSSSLSGNSLNASIQFESTDNSNIGEILKAMVVVTEKNVLKSSYVCCAGANSETQYPWVVRRMLPDESGTTLLNLNPGGSDVVNINWTANNFKDLNEMRIVAFVQNTTTKAIYQSEISQPTINTYIQEKNKLNEKLFTVTNPATSSVMTINLKQPLSIYSFQLLDSFGKTIIDKKIENSVGSNIDISKLENGIYFIKLSNENSFQSQKVLIEK